MFIILFFLLLFMFEDFHNKCLMPPFHGTCILMEEEMIIKINIYCKLDGKMSLVEKTVRF